MTFTTHHLLAVFIMLLQTLNIEFEDGTFALRYADVHHQLSDKSGQEHGPPVSG